MKLITVFQILVIGLADYVMAQSKYTTYKVVVRSYYTGMTTS
jgi:hypothetical protein